MPKTEIDYSNTIIYKITCRDLTVKDVYVGHTTNFVQRKHAHKQSCTNINAKNYKCKLYEVIRNNGGWDNWKMEIINFFNCRDHYEARKKEQEFFISLNATLNSIEPFPKPKAKISNIVLTIENQTLPLKDIITTNATRLTQKFTCELCTYGCSKESDFDKHLVTRKHLNNDKPFVNDIKDIKKYVCQCGKEYNHRQGLYTHKKTCDLLSSMNSPCENIVLDSSNNEIKILTELVLEIMKNNNELLKQN